MIYTDILIGIDKCDSGTAQSDGKSCDRILEAVG